MTVKEYQSAIYPFLLEKFSGLSVVNEWPAFVGNSHQYAPRVDVAIGPFSTTPGHTQESLYNELVETNNIRNFLGRVFAFHRENISSMNISDERMEIEFYPFHEIVNRNQNARCLFAIEIENTSSRKHMLGSLINAASLGRVGIGVAYNESAKRTFVRILNYLAFLKRVEKNTYDTTNFLIITKVQLDSILAN